MERRKKHSQDGDTVLSRDEQLVETKKKQVCQNCNSYNRDEKKCRITGKYVPRKGTCGDVYVN